MLFTCATHQRKFNNETENQKRDRKRKLLVFVLRQGDLLVLG